jgi:hypothetical protein
MVVEAFREGVRVGGVKEEMDEGDRSGPRHRMVPGGAWQIMTD